MNALDAAVQHLAVKVTDNNERQRCIGLLQDMARDCDAAIEVWQEYRARPALPSPADAAVLMHWTGAEIAKQLFDLHLAFRLKMLSVTRGRGNLEDPVIVLAYTRLGEGMTGPDFAGSAIEKLNTAKQAMHAYADKIRTTVPVKSTPAKAAVKKAVAKPAKKKATAKPVIKQVVKKKVPAAATQAKKPLVKKKIAAKPVVKKSVKKVVRKKVTLKKGKKK